MQVSPRRLNGWEPREFTDYVYENDKLVGSIKSREPEFNRDDINLFLALEELDSDVGQYGESIAEAMSPESDNNNRAAKYRYEAVGPYVNHAVAAVEKQQAVFDKKYPDDPKYGHRWAVRRLENPTSEPLQ